MKIYKNVNSSTKVSSLEVNVDTVYIRNNIKETEEGYQYNEVQMSYQEYLETLTNETDAGMLAMMVSMLMLEVDALKQQIGGAK